MKVFVIHDKRGQIRGVVASAMDTVGGKSLPGLRIHKIEKENLSHEEQRRYLIDLHQNFKAETTSGRTTLVRKSLRKRR